MKTYHYYKLKEKEAEKKAPSITKISEMPKIVRIGLVDYVFDSETKSFIPFDEVFEYKREVKW